MEHISYSANHVKFIGPAVAGPYQVSSIRYQVLAIRAGYRGPMWQHMAMHWLDRIAGSLSRRPRFYDPVFAEGWGDEATLQKLQADVAWAGPIPDIEISWSPTIRRDNLRLSEGTFESPAARILPEASRIATVLHVEPVTAPMANCLLLASFNDHGFDTRLKLAKLLAEHGVGSVLLENPYYGVRRPVHGQPLRTVVDFYSMGAGAVLEGRSLLASLHAGSEAPVGVAGYSMGGNIAALVSATVPFPVATAGLAASHSPGPVWIDGLLSGAIVWDALSGTNRKARLGAVLGSVSALTFPPPPHAKHAVLAAPAADGYIPHYAFEDLHAHWPGSELRWIKGGHASVLLWRKKELARAIVDAFERLERVAGT